MSSLSLTKQIEFYFSDANLRRDLHLREIMEKAHDESVQLITMKSFNRLKKYSEEDLRRAIKGSKVLKLTSDERSVRRLEKFNAHGQSTDECDRRTIYIDQVTEKDSIDSIRSQFSRYGDVLMVTIPRHKDESKDAERRIPRGIAFIEFAKVSQAEAAAKAGQDSKDGSRLTLAKSDWLKFRDEFKMKSLQGVVVKVERIGSSGSRNELSDKINSIKKVRFCDYIDGHATAYVRFETKEDAKVVKDYISKNGMRVGGENTRASILEGTEATDYWEKVRKEKAARAERGGRGGRGRGRGRGRGGGGRGGGFRGGSRGGGFGGGDRDRGNSYSGSKRGAYDDEPWRADREDSAKRARY